jgi:hypothetical protein
MRAGSAIADREAVMTDEGLRFFATIRQADGLEVHRETEDRLALLSWLQVHARPGAVVLSLSMEATGPAVPGMIAALKFGARRLARDEGEAR